MDHVKNKSSVLTQLASLLHEGRIQVIDLTAPLSENTPIIQLPPERGQPWPFRSEVISKYDEAGPMVYWNNIRLSEHTGTHFDAPIHWLSGKHLDDISQIPVERLIRPACVIDLSDKISDNDFLLEKSDIDSWCAEHGPLPDGGWLLYRTGWDKRGDNARSFLNEGSTPGISPSCAKWLAEETPIIGVGVETVGTDAGKAGQLDPAYPCHWYMHGSNKYGLTQLRNLKQLPPTGALLVTAPLPIVGGSGSPARILALVER